MPVATANDTSVADATEHNQAEQTTDLNCDLLLLFVEALSNISPGGVARDEYIDVAWTTLDDCHTSDPNLFDEKTLLKHKEIYHMMKYDKQGKDKKNIFFAWCRKIAQVRDSDGIATEHTASEDQESKWYKIEDAHGASRRRPDMQSRFACFCKCDEQ